MPLKATKRDVNDFFSKAWQDMVLFSWKMLPLRIHLVSQLLFFISSTFYLRCFKLATLSYSSEQGRLKGDDLVHIFIDSRVFLINLKSIMLRHANESHKLVQMS
ncbi:hypothetical protein VNO80_17215 [Phaseolus coccineus]|uniref:Uncharacterized protein n=1 Tax=Phaseolus coccineus TaxID=3886 RepID=A0AAN9R8P2_PHACN